MHTPEKQPRPADQERPKAPDAGTVTALFRPAPAWDITDEEIRDWQQSRSGVPGVVIAGYTAAAIRDGRYCGSRELFPPESGPYEATTETIDKAMGMLAARGMVRRSGRAWYPVVPGRLAPSARRAVTALLASRDQLPPALAAELDSYAAALDATSAQAPGRAQASPAAGRAASPARPALTAATG
jgi:hypothetical protein